MTNNAIVQKSEAFVTDLLRHNLTDDHRYHNLQHTLEVRDACLKLGGKLNLPPPDLEVVELAALFHDTGFTKVYEGHETVSQRIAREFLEKQDYPGQQLEAVLECIGVTFPPNAPSNLLEAVMKDADMAHLASEDYFSYIEDLRHEWEVFLDLHYDEEEWNRLNFDFVDQQQYLTSAGQELYDAQRLAHRKTLKKMVKKDKKIAKKKAASPPTAFNLAGSRSAQMMFKTSLRNHLDLSNLADNKANIMLSINALIITVSMPLAASNVGGETRYLLVPLICLLGTSLVTMIFATLATRPIKMNGYTSQEKIQAGQSNLFFFGNFYRMNLDEYREGMQEVVSKEENLENAVMRDLYFLGKSLGNKYRQLRICYTIFMVGIILTVVVFGISYALFAP